MKISRFDEFRFRNGRVARNRVVVPPMASQTADSSGRVTAETVAHYRRLSASGAGLVFVEYSFVHPTGRGEERQLGAEADDKTAGLARVADVIHQAGALAGLQLVHVGGKTTPLLAAGPLIGASAIPVPVKGWQPETPREADPQEIRDLKAWYLAAAGRARAAGFDVVELHAAHGYGLNQWLSPLTNQRKDGYGGSPENRARLLFEIVGGIKARFPELLLAVRLPARDHLEGGLEVGEMSEVVRALEGLGVDLIDVSSGLGGWRRRDDRTEQGYLVEDAALLRRSTVRPVIGVGGILDGETIDRFLRERKLDFAAVGRALLAEPEAWGARHLPRAEAEREPVFKEGS